MYTVLDPRFGWKFVKDDPSWDVSESDLLDLQFESIEERLEREGEPEDPYAIYDNTVYIRRFGSKITADQRALWKHKFIDCYNSCKAAHFKDLPDEYVPPQKTARLLFTMNTASQSSQATSLAAVAPAGGASNPAGIDEDGVPRRLIPSEVARFFALSEEHPLDLDVLSWWKVNQKKFPVLAFMARKILGMMVTAVETERVHSSARHILNWTQGRMGVKTIESALKVKCYAKYNGRNRVEEETPSFESEYLQTFYEDPESLSPESQA